MDYAQTIANIRQLHTESMLGFYEPVVDEKKCTNCGICVKYCPGIKDLKDYYPKTIHSSMDIRWMMKCT